MYKFLSCVFFCISFTISFAQTKTTGSDNGKAERLSGYVQFTSDGKTYGINSDKKNEPKITSELKYSGSTPQFLLTLYVDPSTRDSLILYLYDDKGLPASPSQGFSKDAKLAFVYKLFGKGTMTKAMDNSKGEITSLNFINFSKLEARTGGIIEGSFNFTDIPFKNNTGKVVAKIKEITNGRFKTQITQYSEIKSNGKNEVTKEDGPGQLSGVAKLLFKNVKCKLTDEEKNKIAELTGFVLSNSKEEVFAMDKESMEYPFNAEVQVTDMNKDGTEEIFIQYGNSFTSGLAGQTIVLFIKNKQGVYKQNLGFPGMDPQQLKTSFGGYPDLLIGGPGMQAPVWRWNGKEYNYYKSVKY